MMIVDEDYNPLEPTFRVTASMISELVGSFVFIFLFMLSTDKKT